MPDVIDIERFLRDEGFDTAEARRRARALLEAEGLTRSGKRGMDTAKLPRVRELLESRFLRVCGNGECEQLGGDGARPAREVIAVSPTTCRVCGGSNNRRAALAMARRLKSKDIHRLLVVGGTPALHLEMEELLAPHGIELRFVDGSTGSHSARDAAPDLQWSQVVVVWGASPLPHKVSRLYTDAPPAHVRLVRLSRRGIEALCREVLKSFE